MQSIRICRAPLVLPERLIKVLPPHLSDSITRCGAPAAEELRLHSGRISTVTCGGQSYSTGVTLNADEMNDILKRMCGGSLYAHSQNICHGYLTMDGGIRVGVCGTAALENNRIIGVNNVTGLIVRIPHAVRVNATPVMERLLSHAGLRGVLIYAPPGVGKTTLLRAVAQTAASPDYALRTVVVDSREELTSTLNESNLNLDILTGYPREIGIEIAVRSLGAQLVICDEIGNGADAHAILSAANCGVPLVATAHAATTEDLLSRPALRQLHEARVFGTYAGLRREHENGFRYHFSDWTEAERQLEKQRSEHLG